jgi:hypothetical protein
VSKDNRTYLFFGFAEGTEYSLSPLYNHMLHLGYNCVEIDMMKVPNVKEILRSLKNEKIVFLTSAHMFMDGLNIRSIYNVDGEVIGPLEVIDYLKPEKKVYYPHDLINPLLVEDLRWLSLFDILLSPYSWLSHYKRYTEVIDVGWIKKKNSSTPKKVTGKPKFLHPISAFHNYYQFGFEKFWELWGPVYDLGVTVKFPNWPGAEEFENKLKALGVNVFPREGNIFDSIENHDVIITNGDTSVTIESALSGRPTINVIDSTVSVDIQQKSIFGLPNIQISSINECKVLIEDYILNPEKVRNTEDLLKPFDYNKAVSVITTKSL